MGRRCIFQNNYSKYKCEIRKILCKRIFSFRFNCRRMSNVPWTLLWRCRIIHLARRALCNADNDERNERETKKTAKRFGEEHCLVSRSVLRLSEFLNEVSRHMHKMEIEIEINRRVKSRSMQDKLDINVLFHFSSLSVSLSLSLF